ncbi:MAG: GNAT family N-acetyltransferase [Rikenellaceae bacterium]|nr:GNAT family N-acetyltransferase [Rikenellaceae bacterium]
MIFRKATHADIDRIAEIVSYASQRLHKAGIDQWQRGYPNRQSVENDVNNGVGMVLSLGNEILAYGAVIFTGERAYDDLTGGEWLTKSDTTAPRYAVIHRLCVSEIFVGMGFAKQFVQAAEAMAAESAESMRIDTHPDNRIMQGLVASLGYTYCGDVVIESRRLAYEKVL